MARADAPPASALPADLADRFVVRREGRRSALVRTDFAGTFDAAGLLEAAGLEPRELVTRLEGRGARLLDTDSGRGPVAVVPTEPPGEAVVRPYRRGGLARRFSRRRYLLGRRGERELVVTERLRRRGVPVVEPLACVREELGPGYRAALITRFVDGARPAGEVLASLDATAPTPEGVAADAATSLMRALGRTAAGLHAAGGWHPDLHVDNFLVRDPTAEPSAAPPAPFPLLVDLDRGRLFPFPVPTAVGHWSLRRLARHLRKRRLEAALAAFWALEAAYVEAREGESEGEKEGEARGSSGS